jgi:hypothetical protein
VHCSTCCSFAGTQGSSSHQLKPSNDPRYTTYTVNSPSVTPPNWAWLTRFRHIDQLAGGDSCQLSMLITTIAFGEVHTGLLRRNRPVSTNMTFTSVDDNSLANSLSLAPAASPVPALTLHVIFPNLPVKLPHHRCVAVSPNIPNRMAFQ